MYCAFALAGDRGFDVNVDSIDSHFDLLERARMTYAKEQETRKGLCRLHIVLVRCARGACAITFVFVQMLRRLARARKENRIPAGQSPSSNAKAGRVRPPAMATRAGGTRIGAASAGEMNTR